MERRIRVILFDDNPDIRRLLERFLKDRGCEVFVYEDPSLCPLQHSHSCHCSEKEQCADILLTDIDMPHVSGLDFIDSQVIKGCKIQNIGIMSGEWSDLNRQRAKKLGCAVFDKPFSMSVLWEWLNQCMERLDRDTALSNWFRHEGEESGSAESAAGGDA
jgi:DNA-binding response OmpR family regulator